MSNPKEAKVIDNILIIPEGREIIEDSEFMGRADFNDVSLPESLIGIERSAFAACINLEKLTLPKGLLYVDEFAFNGCVKLRELTILGAKTKLYGFNCGSFKGCCELSRLEIVGDCENLCYDETEATDYGELYEVFDDCEKLKDIRMTEATWDNNFGGWKELGWSSPTGMGGLLGEEIYLLKLEKMAERHIAQQKAEQKSENASALKLEAVLSQTEFEGREPRFNSLYAGTRYELMVKITNSGRDVTLSSIELELPFFLPKIYLDGEGIAYSYETADVAIALHGEGVHEIKEARKIKLGETVTLSYSIAHRPPEYETHPHEYAFYCLRMRALAKSFGRKPQYSEWSPHYVCALGTAVGWQVEPECWNVAWEEYDFVKYSCRAKAVFEKFGAPIGDYFSRSSSNTNK